MSLSVKKSTKHSVGSCLACPPSDTNRSIYEIAGGNSTFRLCEMHMRLLGEAHKKLKPKSCYVGHTIEER